MENHTARNFVLQLGSLASLYLSLSFLLVLTFGLINLLLPDPTDTTWEIENASSMVRIGIAMVLVFGPTYLILTKHVNRSRRSDKNGTYLSVTKWLIYLSLLVGGAVLLGDLVAVIMAFLEGEITTRFTLKALAVFIAVGAAFYYYLKDAKGYWIAHEKESNIIGVAVNFVWIIMVFMGFMNINSPAEVREAKLDDRQISDLQQLQWQIADYLAIEGELPENLDDLTNALLPEAAAGRSTYQYNITEKGFSLCADFSAASEDTDYYYARPVTGTEMKTPIIVNPDNWQHNAGTHCFERVVQSPDETSDI